MDCVLCGQTTPAKDRFRLREKRGTPTHLGSLIVSLLEADLWEDTDCSVCRTCRRALLRLEKLKADYDALKGDLKAKVRRGSRQVRLHSRSPTGTTATGPHREGGQAVRLTLYYITYSLFPLLIN